MSGCGCQQNPLRIQLKDEQLDEIGGSQLGHLATLGDILLVTTGEGKYCTQYIEARAAAQHPTMHRQPL